MPAVDPSKPPQGKANGDWFPWQIVWAKEGTPSAWKRAKKVWAKQIVPPSTTPQWVEVWNARPEVSLGTPTSSAYDRITLKGNVDANGFSTTPRFYYRVKNTGSYIDSGALTAVTGDGAVAVEKLITGLTEQTTYQYYLYAENECGVAQTAVGEITTVSDCSQGFVLTSTVTTPETCATCDCGSSTRDKIVKTYEKTGCTSYTTTTYTTCTSCGTWVDLMFVSCLYATGIDGAPSGYYASGAWGHQYYGGSTDCSGNLTLCDTYSVLLANRIQECAVSGTYRAVGVTCFTVGGGV